MQDGSDASSAAPSPQTSSQQYTAHLKFESCSGPKRLDLYPLHGNRKLPGAPSTTIRLTHVLGVVSNKHSVSRTKNTFQVRNVKQDMEEEVTSLSLSTSLHYIPNVDRISVSSNGITCPSQHSSPVVNTLYGLMPTT